MICQPIPLADPVVSLYGDYRASVFQLRHGSGLLTDRRMTETTDLYEDKQSLSTNWEEVK